MQIFLLTYQLFESRFWVRILQESSFTIWYNHKRLQDQLYAKENRKKSKVTRKRSVFEGHYWRERRNLRLSSKTPTKMEAHFLPWSFSFGPWTFPYLQKENRRRRLCFNRRFVCLVTTSDIWRGIDWACLLLCLSKLWISIKL